MVARFSADSKMVNIPVSYIGWHVVFTLPRALDQDLSGINGTVYMGYLPSNNNPFLWKGKHHKPKRPSRLVHQVELGRCIDQPLAENFSLADGVVNVRCPLNLPTGGRYVIACEFDAVLL